MIDLNYYSFLTFSLTYLHGYNRHFNLDVYYINRKVNSLIFIDIIYFEAPVLSDCWRVICLKTLMWCIGISTTFHPSIFFSLLSARGLHIKKIQWLLYLLLHPLNQSRHSFLSSSSLLFLTWKVGNEPWVVYAFVINLSVGFLFPNYVITVYITFNFLVDTVVCWFDSEFGRVNYFLV